MKICFVVMGYGTKQDYRNGRKVDLDRIYEEIIKKTFEDLPDYSLIRADELSGSGNIDVDMYELLLGADLVIADITSLNENALYELGVRHALRPYSTIIMMMNVKMEDGSESHYIPFDIGHDRMLRYKDYGEWLDEEEAAGIRSKLMKFVRDSEKHNIDSPLYEYLKELEPPAIPPSIERKVVEKAERFESRVNSALDDYRNHKDASEFKEALPYIEKLYEELPNNEYIIQQYAFCTYKAASGNKKEALDKAWKAISELNPDKSLNQETLGIAGSICKRLYKETEVPSYLDRAIRYYLKGYIQNLDYYNGENVINCLLLKILTIDDQEEIDGLKFICRTIAKKIRTLLDAKLETGEVDIWMYATMANCCAVLGDDKAAAEYERYFMNDAKEWQKASYKESIDIVRQVMGVGR